METRRCYFFLLLAVVVSWVKSQDTFVIPRLRITTFTKGLRLSLNHVEGMQFVLMIANINKELTLSANSGDIVEEIDFPVNNRWTADVPDIELKVHDVINYKLAVKHNGTTHFSKLFSYTVQVLVPIRSATEDAIIWPGTVLSAGDTDQNRPSPITVKPASSASPSTVKPASSASPITVKPASPASPVKPAPINQPVQQQTIKPPSPTGQTTSGNLGSSTSSNIETANRNQQGQTPTSTNQNVGNSNQQVIGKPTTLNPANIGSPKPPVVANLQPTQQNAGLPISTSNSKPSTQPNQQSTGMPIPVHPPNVSSPKPSPIQPNQQNTGEPIPPNLGNPKPPPMQPNPNPQNTGVPIAPNLGNPKPPIQPNPNQQNTGIVPPNLGNPKPLPIQPNPNQQNIGVPIPSNLGNPKPPLTQPNPNQQNSGIVPPNLGNPKPPPMQPNPSPQNAGMPIPLNPPNVPHILPTTQTGVTNPSVPLNNQNAKPSTNQPAIHTSMPVRIQKPAPLKPKPIAPVLAAGRPDSSGSSEGSSSCKRSNTLVKGQRVCKGALIFEDHFDTLDSKKWTRDIRIADEPDYEFCIYDKRPENTFVQGGILHLRPSLTERIHGQKFMTTGFLQLDECTGSSSAECEQQASFGYVMPAVTSSRLRSSFSFIYGRVEIRAKMASGDWLLSSLLLQPVRSNYYGANYVAGQMRLGMARGNKDLQCDDVEYGISQVEAGVVLAVADDQIMRELSSRELARGYNRDFHTYRVDWLPDKITFFIDGRVATTITPPQDGFASLFEDSDVNPWKRGSKLAPFDREFVPALRLSAGGIHDFPDNCIGNGKPKPWQNNHPKARLYFYQNQTLWAPTWSDTLQIDYIKIWAL